MRSLKTLVLFAAFAVLLPAQNACAADAEDLKNRIGQTMGKTIKKQGYEFLKAAIANVQNFYDELLAQVNLGDKEIARIKLTQKKMQIYCEELPTMEKAKLIELFENLINNHTGIRAYRDEIYDEKKPGIVNELVEKSADDLHKHEFEFLNKIDKTWQELYATIPAEELTKHKEYNEISRILSEVKHAKIKGPALLEFLQAVIRFFDFKDWKFLLDLKQTPKTLMYYFNVRVEGMNS